MASRPVNDHVFSSSFYDPHTVVDALPCPSGYTYRQPSRLCYKVFNQESDYSSAKATCSSDGGTLAMPRDAATNTFLINLKNAVDNSAYFRFGLTDISQEGRWVWEDGRVLGGFSSWGSGEPNNLDNNEDCAEYFSGNHVIATARNKWNDISCSDHPSRKFAFISCPSGYTYHQASRLCYKAFNQESDYSNAKATCTSEGGTLAMPRDAAINTFLINLKNDVDLNAAFFFGLIRIRHERRWEWVDACPSEYVYRETNRMCYKAYDLKRDYSGAKATCSSDGGTLAMPRDAATDNFLIDLKNAVDRTTAFFFGLTRIRLEGRWEWEDGADLGDFHPWGPREPSDSGGDQDCVEYVSATWYEAALRDTWNDIACYYDNRKFICQVPPT
ncbi:uncharacterized protein LOC144919470 [Branchiostoma floridae x Branchiostoma belcheri]